MRAYAESVSWSASACSPWQTFSSAWAVTHHPLHALLGHSVPMVFLIFRGSDSLSVLWPYWLWYWCNYSRSAIFKNTTHMTGFEYDGEVDLGVSLLYFKGWMDYFFFLFSRKVLTSFCALFCFYCVGPRCLSVMTSCCTEDVHAVGDWYPRCWSW